MTAGRYTIPRLPPELEARGGSVDKVADELKWVISDAVRHHPRTLQRRIGPSEIGHPCPRRIGYKLLDHPDVNANDVAWKPTVGTAVHDWIAQAFDRFNLMFDESTGSGQERFLVEHRVVVGQINGVDVDGSADVYDRVTATVVDWKIVGPDQLRIYSAKGPGDQYRSQLHLYGRGFANAGLPVDHVMIVFLPRNGEFDQTVVWAEEYDEQVAVDALARAQAIATTVAVGGPAALPLLPTHDSWCYRCPYFKAGSIDLSSGCPGDMSNTRNQPAPLTLSA